MQLLHLAYNQNAADQNIPTRSACAKPGKLRGRLLRDPDATGRDALLRFDALLAQPRSTRLLQGHAVHARAVCAACLLAPRTVFACRHGDVAGRRK